MKYCLRIISLITLLGGGFLFCTAPLVPIASGGSGTETVGICVNAQNLPVSGARVLLVSLADSTIRYKDTTNDTGAFYYDSIGAGAYYLFGYTGDTSLVVYDTLKKAKLNEVKNLGRLTMKTPGSVAGFVSVDGEKKAGVHIYIPGTSFGAMSSDSGTFHITGIYNGVYPLYYYYPKYALLKVPNILVVSGNMVLVDSVNLSLDTLDPPPPPKKISATFDTVESKVSLRWSKVAVSDFRDYVIYKTDSTGKPKRIDTTSDTTYTDMVTFNDKDSVDTLVYQLKTEDRQNNESEIYSSPCTIVAVSRKFVRTTISWVIPDTIVTGKKVMLAAKFSNKTRKNRTIRWFFSDPFVADTEHSVDSKEGIDTIRHLWTDTNSHYIWIEAVDCKDNVWRDSCTILVGIIDTPDTWKAINPLIYSRKLLAIAALGATIYTVGGKQTIGGNKVRAEQSVAYSEKIDVTESKWKEITRIDTSRHAATLSVVGGSLYLVGGSYQGIGYREIRSVLRYDITMNKWSVTGVMPWIRFGHTACVINDSIYIFGGYLFDSTSTLSITSRIDVFDPKTKGWSYKGEMLSPRVNHQTVLVDAKVYIIGGQRDEEMVLSSMEVYDLITRGQRLTGMSIPRVNFGAIALQDTIFIFGGLTSLSDGKITNDNEAYIINQDRWIKRKEMPKPSYGFGVCAVERTIYVIGGCEKFGTSTGQVGAVYKYIP